MDDEDKRAIKASWDETWGDRVQQLVFIGTELDKAATIQALDWALLSDEEAAQGVALWHTFPDPLPKWEMV